MHGSINMLGLTKHIKAKIFQASTSEVYGAPIVMAFRPFSGPLAAAQRRSLAHMILVALYRRMSAYSNLPTQREA
jgi:GDP-D-mannose dehydratase